jgi:preprotein translocase subunit SecD
VINVVFTDDGANKMHDLTAAQLKKSVAMVVDRKVLWAPMVTSVTPVAKSFSSANTSTLTGSTPQGLTQEEVELIMGILRRAPPR